MNLLKILLDFFPEKTAFAHCDVPCGIYSAEPSKMAAKTILTMVQKILALPKNGSEDEVQQARNTFVRTVWTKEEHARILKHELTVLWADYFKVEHLEMFPDLHDVFWQALKLCSKNKQTVSLEDAQKLVDHVDQIAAMFAKAEDAKRKAS